jgi:predicted transcriptional regulator
MSDSTDLSRRERQIMDLVFSLGTATVNQVAEGLPDPTTSMAVRRMMHILEEKKFLTRRQEGREMVYRPLQSKARAGVQALQHVLDTFFGGAVDEALAAHFSKKQAVSPEQFARMKSLIEESRKKGNNP